MSKSLDIPKNAVGSDKPQTKIGRELTGDDYKESLKLQAELEKLLGKSSRQIPKRELVFRIADELIIALNELDDEAEAHPDSLAGARLDQLHYNFGTENIIDLAMITANMELKKREKDKYKTLTGDKGAINLKSVAPRSTLTGEGDGSTSKLISEEARKSLFGTQE